jgi:hypothetical protein
MKGSVYIKYLYLYWIQFFYMCCLDPTSLVLFDYYCIRLSSLYFYSWPLMLLIINCSLVDTCLLFCGMRYVFLWLLCFPVIMFVYFFLNFFICIFVCVCACGLMLNSLSFLFMHYAVCTVLNLWQLCLSCGWCIVCYSSYIAVYLFFSHICTIAKGNY